MCFPRYLSRRVCQGAPAEQDLALLWWERDGDDLVRNGRVMRPLLLPTHAALAPRDS